MLVATPAATPTVRAERLLTETTTCAKDVSRIGNEIINGDIGEARSLRGHLNMLGKTIDDLSYVAARAGAAEGAAALDEMASSVRQVTRAAVVPPGASHMPLLKLAEVGHASASLGDNIASTLATLTAAQLLRPSTSPSPTPDAPGPEPEAQAAAELQAALAAEAAAAAAPHDGAGEPVPMDVGQPIAG